MVAEWAGTNPVRELLTNTKNNYNLPIKMIAKDKSDK
jgi:hypothetical protein